MQKGLNPIPTSQVFDSVTKIINNNLILGKSGVSSYFPTQQSVTPWHPVSMS